LDVFALLCGGGKGEGGYSGILRASHSIPISIRPEFESPKEYRGEIETTSFPYHPLSTSPPHPPALTTPPLPPRPNLSFHFLFNLSFPAFCLLFSAPLLGLERDHEIFLSGDSYLSNVALAVSGTVRS